MSFGLNDVTVELGGRIALHDLDLAVERGELTVLIGADGAGKTTTARTMVGLVHPVAGSVRRPERDRVGYQPEAAGTWRDLTVAENLSFVAVAHGIDPRSERVGSLLDLTGLEAAVERLAGALSGGMRQKLAVAMAMLPNPELAVLDEPTTGLDPVSRADLWRLLARAAGEGTAILVTSTYLDEAERASHVVVLDQGRELASGTALSIRRSFPGTLTTSPTPPGTGHSWRRGSSWRVWSPEGKVPFGGQPIQPDLDDVVTVAALARREQPA